MLDYINPEPAEEREARRNQLKNIHHRMNHAIPGNPPQDDGRISIVAIAAKIITTAAIAAITIGLFYCLAWMAHRAFA